MNEQLRYGSDEQRISRRELVCRGGRALAATAFIGTGFKLNEGISLNKPPIEVRTITIDRVIDDQQLLYLESSTEAAAGETVTIERNGRLFVEPRGLHFLPGRQYRYAHRVNGDTRIDEALLQDVDLIDIDANKVVDGGIYGEHGFIPQIDLSLGRFSVRRAFPLVIDQNESGIKLGKPKYKYEDLIAYIGKKAQENEKPLAVSTELKRGTFDPDTLNEMIEIHKKYEVPALMYPVDSDRIMAEGGLVAWL